MKFTFKGPPKYDDIPPFTRSGSYMVNVGLDYLPGYYIRHVIDLGLDVSPDFQRDYVWTQDQKIAFMEYMLRGGKSGLDIYTNAPFWQHGDMGKENPKSWYVLVDGKQRLDAALGFLNNEFPVFGAYAKEFKDRLRFTQGGFRWHVNDLKTRAEVLQWYLDLNTGGTIHSDTDLDKVRSLLPEADSWTPPSYAEAQENGNLGRAVIQKAIVDDAAYEAKIAAETAARNAAKPKGKKRSNDKGIESARDAYMENKRKRK